MAENLTVTVAERLCLRELARQYVEYAHRPIMAQRAARRYDHSMERSITQTGRAIFTWRRLRGHTDAPED